MNAETIVTQEFLQKTSVADEEIFRDIALRIIRDVPIKELQKIMKFEKIDPSNELFQHTLKRPSISTEEKNILLSLLYENRALYKTECDFESTEEKLLKFIDWLGTWQTNKNLDNYGINDIYDEYKKFSNENEN